MNVFIGADIGTTGIRAGVYDEDFNLIGSGSGSSIGTNSFTPKVIPSIPG